MTGRVSDRRPRLVAVAIAAGLALVAGAAADEHLPVAWAITGVEVVAAPGEVIENATVVVRDGIIEAVGPEVGVPEAARVVEGEGLTLYPGLIEAYHSRSWPNEEEESGDESGEVGHDNALVAPERSALEIAADVKAAERLRASGFATALIVPEDGLWRGSAVLVNLGAGDLRHNLLRRDVVQAARFATHGSYPNSLMGSVALMRQTLLDAQWYARAHDAWDRNPLQGRPPVDLSLEALGPVARGEQAVLFEARDVLDLLRFAGLAREFSLNAWAVGSGDEYQYLDEVAATGLPLLVPVDFPDAPELKDDALDNLGVELSELVEWNRAPENPALLADEGVRFAFTAAGLSNPSDLFGKVSRAIERGLSEDQALAALTTVPASMLGIDALMGTIEPGKAANLLLVEGDLFVDKPKLRDLWIDGHRFELEAIEPAEVNPVGTWALKVDTGEGELPVEVEITGELGNLSGTTSVMGNTLPLSSVSVSGSTVEIVIDSSGMGAPGEIVLRLDVEGESASGSGDSPMGSFSVSGRRTSGPPEVQR